CDSGFGNALAFRLNSMGFRVYACVLDTESTGAQDLRTNSKFPHNMVTIEVNVTNDTQIDRCFAHIQRDLMDTEHQLWSVVNNAGVCSSAYVEWGSMDEWHRVFDINVFGVGRVTRTFLPLLRPAKGRVVFTSSISGRTAGASSAVYAMSKFSVSALADALRQEMSPFEIKVSTIEPSAFKTPIIGLAVRSMATSWAQTDQSVREVYGLEFYETLNKDLSSLLSSSFLSSNTDVVVDDMVDAITSISPKRRYSPTDGWTQRVFNLLKYLPDEWKERLFSMNSSVKPKYVQS
ncbi:unnamed protein product, partial [Medioppia subpectinata]